MSLCCPKCGSRNLRFSRTRDASERLWKLVGVRAMRCRDCKTRFVQRTWNVSDLAYARCPRCWRMDLNRWNEKQFQAPNYMLLALKLGANPYRCEYCRFNFVSFRRRKEKFSFQRWEKRRARQEAESGAAEQPAAVAAAETPQPEIVPQTAPEPAPLAEAAAAQAAAGTAPARVPRLVEHAPASAAEAIAFRKAAQRKLR
jgi:hypothetical protein